MEGRQVSKHSPVPCLIDLLQVRVFPAVVGLAEGIESGRGGFVLFSCVESH